MSRPPCFNGCMQRNFCPFSHIAPKLERWRFPDFQPILSSGIRPIDTVFQPPFVGYASKQLESWRFPEVQRLARPLTPLLTPLFAIPTALYWLWRPILSGRGRERYLCPTNRSLYFTVKNSAFSNAETPVYEGFRAFLTFGVQRGFKDRARCSPHWLPMFYVAYMNHRYMYESFLSHAHFQDNT